MLIDTSGFLCLFHAAERQQQDAITFFNAASLKLTTSYVLAEFVALAHARRLPRQPALDFVAAIQTSTEITVVYVHEALHLAAIDLLQQRLDKDWSLCDAVSIVLQQQYGILETLTTDHHFEQAGFVRLLQS